MIVEIESGGSAVNLKKFLNTELTAEIVPRADADQPTMAAFALSLKCPGLTQGEIINIGNMNRQETLTDLRICLYFEQRRWVHCAGPDEDGLQRARRLLDMIRAKVIAGQLS